MSAITMGRRAASATAQPLGDAAPGDGDDFLGRLVKYIPADIVGGYVAVFALVDTTNDNYRDEWITAWVFLVLTPFVVLSSFTGKLRREQSRWPSLRELPFFPLFAATAAFAAWIVVLPETPVVEWFEVSGLVQAIVLVATTIVLTGLGYIFEPV